MLKKWNVEGFKSIYEKKEFEMAPMTIFTGANSSGKSSLIQSILLTVQTFQNPLKSNRILLNGPLLRLGGFEDIRSYGTNKDITIGFGLNFKGITSDIETSDEFHKDDIPTVYDDDDFEGNYPEDYYPEIPCEIEVDYRFAFHPSDNESQFYPKVNMVKFKDYFATYDEIDFNEIIVEENKLELGEKKQILKIKDLGKELESILRYDVHQTNKDSILARVVLGPINETIPMQIVGASFKNFLFYDLYELEDLNLTITNLILDRYSNDGNPLSKDYFRVMQSKESLNIFKKILLIIFKHSDESGIISIPTQDMEVIKERFARNNDFNSFHETLTFIEVKFLEKLSFDFAHEKKLRRKIVNYIKETLHPVYTVIKVNDKASPYERFISDYFKERVKYLGPLREEPRPIYNNLGSINSSDVGNKGEYTTFALELNKDLEIRYISPSSLEEKEYEIKDGKLIHAVLEWIIYLGIGNDIQTVDQGSIGRRLKIQLEKNGKFVDLTNVGVGVSQILPILVSSLLAEKHSTLIFEQPELHLHPKVQTRLADFFLTIVKLDKQCIIETHSEHMINRLRYKAVSSPKDIITDNALIYFVERETGVSEYRPIHINEYGGIGEWPKGFFDESELNALSILKAVRTKKRGE